MNNKDDIKAVVGNIPIKDEKKKKNNKKKTNDEYKYPVWVRVLVWVMALMMFLSFAGSLIVYFISAINS